MTDDARVHDLVVIGAGPAGLAAGIYAGRGGMDVVLLDMMGGGGQVNIIDRVENYPGLVGVENGMALAEIMSKQAAGFGANITFDEVSSIDTSGERLVVTGGNESYKAKAVLVASGAGHRVLGAPGEGRLSGKGVSYCATCDGNFFRGQPVAVVGGGNSAVMEALYLSRIVERVTLIHRRDKLRAEKVLQDRFFAAKNCEVIWNSTVDEIAGKDEVEGVKISDKQTGQSRLLEVAAVFIFVGLVPNTGFLKGVVDLDQNGFVKTDVHMRTSHPAIFAAGDVRADSARQIGTAVGDGITATIRIQEMLDTDTPPRQYNTP